MNMVEEARSGTASRDEAMPAFDAQEIISARNISKRFPGVLALDCVYYGLRRGEVHALCGENGAGKSTLMKIISGLYPPDGGQVLYKGVERRFEHITDAQNAGIAIIHQELNLVPHLSVAENIFLAREPLKCGLVDRKSLNAQAQALLDRMKCTIKATDLVKTLSVAQQQMVEIAKALSLNAEVLIMDEPTSSLTESEIEQLFIIINRLKSEGVGIVYISHRLDEFQHIVDRVTVFRDGRFVCTHDFKDFSVDEIVAAMVGRSLEEKFPERVSRPTDEIIFRAKNVKRTKLSTPISFEVRKGEILGFAGLMGAGRTEVARAIFGADPKDGGSIFVGDTEVQIHSPIDAIRHGIAYLSEDRKAHGIALKMPVSVNVTLANTEAVCQRFGFIDFKKEASVAERYVKTLAIRTPSVKQIVKNLSGGNQQKVVISKWLFRESKVLFFDEPTRGIDVGAKFAIYQLLDQLASEGIGVVLISSELPEILGLTDRVAVFHEGKMTGMLNTRETNQEEIMQYASGRRNMFA